MKDSHQKAAEDHNLAAHAQRTAAALTQEVDNKSGRETGALASPVCGAGDSSHTPGLIRRATLPIGFVFVFAAVAFGEFPSGHITTTSAIDGHLGSEGSFNFSLFDATSNTQVGWVMLDYDTSSHRIGGYSAFRYRAGGVINEALVPISGYDDTRFYMSFDNIEGFATG